jgi:hypothetical protein
MECSCAPGTHYPDPAAVEWSDGSISIYPPLSLRVTRATAIGTSINRCQEKGGARDWNAECEVEETGVGRKIQEIDGLRQQEHRRCRE